MSEPKIASISSLRTLLVDSKGAEVEYPGLPGFKVNVAFLSRDVLQKIRKKATSTTFKRGSLVESMNDDLFLKLYVESAVKGWTGLTMAYVAQLAPIDVTGIDPNSELEFNEENALYLMKSSSSFDSWISDTVSDLGNFSKSSDKK